MKEDLKKAAERVRKLLNITAENGASEQEVLNASAAAHAIIEKHQLQMSDLELEAEGVERLDTDRRSVLGKTLNFKYGTRDKISAAIARYCDCKVWRNPREQTISFFGLRSDAELAVWLSDTLTYFITVEADRHMLTETRVAEPRWHYRVWFINGAATRINQRLKELADEREAHRPKKTASGNSLVVVKNAIVEREYGKLGMDVVKRRSGQTIGLDGRAFLKGVEAGDRANLARPIEQDASETKQIGHQS